MVSRVGSSKTLGNYSGNLTCKWHFLSISSQVQFFPLVEINDIFFCCFLNKIKKKDCKYINNCFQSDKGFFYTWLVCAKIPLTLSQVFWYFLKPNYILSDKTFTDREHKKIDSLSDILYTSAVLHSIIFPPNEVNLLFCTPAYVRK